MKFAIIILGIAFVSLTACQKEEGVGGKASIKGKVYIKDYNAEFTHVIEEYYAPEIDVYITYGNNETYSDKFKTHYDGSYGFKYLRTGTYTVFTYSKDSILRAPVVVKQTIEITEKDQEIVLEDLIIKR